MMARYERGAVQQTFNTGDLVLMLAQVPCDQLGPGLMSTQCV